MAVDTHKAASSTFWTHCSLDCRAPDELDMSLQGMLTELEQQHNVINGLHHEIENHRRRGHDLVMQARATMLNVLADHGCTMSSTHHNLQVRCRFEHWSNSICVGTARRLPCEAAWELPLPSLMRPSHGGSWAVLWIELLALRASLAISHLLVKDAGTGAAGAAHAHAAAECFDAKVSATDMIPQCEYMKYFPATGGAAAAALCRG